MSRILGLDLGTNSIGWALLDTDKQAFIKTGSRIIPMDAATLGDYENGNLKSGAAERTGFRGMRRLYERSNLRRERLLRVLNVMGFLPEHFCEQIDFEQHPGQFKNHGEPKIAWRMGADGKSEFIFKDAFLEMVEEFRKSQPSLVGEGKKVPYDWTIYYLRHKALTQPITKEELAWLLLNFNAKRGYYQLKGEMEEQASTNKREEYKILTVKEVVKLEEKSRKSGFSKYEIRYDDGTVQPVESRAQPHQVGDRVELIVTTMLDNDGNVKLTKDGEPKISVRSPKDDDWTLRKIRTEHEIYESGQTVGSYIYSHLLTEPDVKVRGKLVHTVERKLYKEELRRILERQKEFLPELSDTELYVRCVRELYRQNDAHAESLSGKDLTSLLIDDILFYQRPLKSKKSLIEDCPYESYHYRDGKTGELVEVPIKCIPKSNPLFQEFRLWQFVGNLRIFKRENMVDGKLRTDCDVTSEFLKTKEDRACLFDWLNTKKEIKQDDLLKYKPFGIGKEAKAHRWNYVEDRAYPCNETFYEINRRLAQLESVPTLSPSDIQQIWHIAYSVCDPTASDKALRSFARNHSIDEDAFVELFGNYAIAKKDYGAYSEKAIKKLLSLMRMGHHWSAENIPASVMQRVEKIIDGEADESISIQTMEKAEGLERINDFQGLPLWQACYIIYGRHSETQDMSRWQSPEDIDQWMKTSFKQHSLRNPVVEAVLGETLRLVRDLWKECGKIDEVHVELGRSLKKDAKGRAKDLKRQQENEQTNRRIRTLLREMAEPDSGVDNVRPHSPSQQELLKIFENEVLSNPESEMDDEIKTIVGNMGKAVYVSHSDVMRYRLWLEQRYKSPYTGKVIPLSKLFTTAYEIEHVIPQSRYFDDSLNNKVICESEVNKEKDRMLGYEFITKKGGSIVKGAGGQDFRIFSKEEYEEFVRNHYKGKKMKNLLLDDIPAEFVQRQMNDTRYMSRRIIGILSMLVRDEGEEEATSKHIIATNGSITDRLKSEWGIKDIWNQIVALRFERLNEKTGTSNYGEWKNDGGKRYFQINIPDEIATGFSKKRIDHRHHAMDAMVIACTTRDMVNYLNNCEAAEDKRERRYDLQHKLCTKVKTDDRGNYVWRFNQPWEGFPADVKAQLEGIIVSFKQNLRVINKMTNHYQHYENSKKVYSRQTKGDGWAIRKSLHKDTVSGFVTLQRVKQVKLSEALKDWKSIKDKAIKKEVKRVIALYNGKCDEKTLNKYFKDRGFKLGNKDISKVEVYYYTSGKDALSASRKPLDTSFNEEKIRSITDTGIQKILLRHLHNYDDPQGKQHPEQAFSPEGIEEMNRNLRQLNDGKDHKPIIKVRKTETFGMKFPVGENGAKRQKFVEADKGTNLFFAIYEDENGQRSYESIPFNVVVERMKNHQPVAEARNSNGALLKFTLSPGDLVYLPNDVDHPEKIDRKRIYKMVSCNKKQCFFVPYAWASIISDGIELGSMNKIEMALTGENIKAICLKLIVDRLGNIVKIQE